MVAVEPGALTVQVAATLDDQVRFNDVLLAQPAMRRRRRAMLLVTLLVYPLAG